MTQEEFDKEYSKEAALIGHKTFLIKLLQDEIHDHLKTCIRLREEKEKAVQEAQKNCDV